MAETTNFELVSPEKLLVSQPVEMVVVPGTEGYFGVLPRHAPFISTLIPGVIQIYEGGQIKERIFVAGGFAEVTEDRCTVLADEAVPLDEIDRAEVEQRIKTQKEDLADAKSDAEKAALQARLDVSNAMIRALDTGH
ncbi:MAG: F0F1 ATP synthase subunit epsilon [Alphaproteobacteria bacterium]|nr:F0F1 ATP synthase subunit epsilon [Alphaproteobacteria bacterium]MBU0798448.1 F0F1 ATP synthase subunit epsilon [Alphaproteobacteria bacterium]MBU0888406.1 F0F1 ATP synthase subunit epsilon [Alphaproteobacteria bacterium]MBU1814717.1 F0F1 ATP synthase subunit epsilon [Alphaproteobacteria bacterium]MBU2091356.1 F0F1 ATP synthase subunit epsilon [Alphaproteobacteria bacterium]